MIGVHPRRLISRRAFTLVEILIVVTILGILAALVVPRFTNAQEQSQNAALERQLQIIRVQIVYYRERTGANPDMTNWDALVNGDYLRAAPTNPLNGSSAIGTVGDFSGGWVWRDSGTGTFQIYATNLEHTGEYVPPPPGP